MFAINILVKLLDDKIQLRYSEREQNNTVEYIQKTLNIKKFYSYFSLSKYSFS